MPITGMQAGHWEYVKTKAAENGLSIEIVGDRFRLLRGETSLGRFNNTDQLYNCIWGYECGSSDKKED